MKKFYLLSGIFAMLTSVAFAQNLTVTGNVRDASNGDPVPFSSVHQKGTMNGVVTDADGHYSITVTSDAVLVFSSVGYKSLEIPVNGKMAVDADLPVDTETLDDVIVVAYGTTSREANTGAVT